MWCEKTCNKIQKLVEYARQYVPYYANLLPSVVQLPSNNYFEAIPLLSRQILQMQKARFYSLVVDPSSCRKIQTTGTTGEPVQVILSKEALDTEAMLLALQITRSLQSTHWRQNKLFHLTLHTGATSRTLPSPWHIEGQTIKWNLIRAWQLADEQFVKVLSCLNQSVITTMSSIAELLCSRILKIGSTDKVHPSLVVLSGETIPSEIRTLITKVFNCPVTSLYTMAEIGIIGSERFEPNAYQVEEQAAIVEIVDEKGNRVPQGVEGEIVVTSLNNLAMPLIRYRTGDRGFWVNIHSSPPIFRLVEVRRSKHLITKNNALIHVVRFAKVLASLHVDRYQLDQKQDGTVIFSYFSRQGSLNEMDYSLVKTIIRGALGPEVKIELCQFTDREAFTQPTNQEHFSQEHAIVKTEPLGPDLEEIAYWLRQQLFNEVQVEAALLTGSAVNPLTMTRFSDIDLVVFVRDSPIDSHWVELSRNLKSCVPRLSISFDNLESLSKRDPLLTCRLLCEQISLIGKIDEHILSWPILQDIRLQGMYWSQGAIATLWLRLVNSKGLTIDPIHEAWIAAKFIVDALRYRYLVRGERKTAAISIIQQVENDSDIIDSWKKDLHEVFNVAREYQPPPLIGSNSVERYLKLALSYIRFVQTELIQNKQMRS